MYSFPTQVTTQPFEDNYATLTCSPAIEDGPWSWLLSISTHQDSSFNTSEGGGHLERQETLV